MSTAAEITIASAFLHANAPQKQIQLCGNCQHFESCKKKNSDLDPEDIVCRNYERREEI